MTSDASASAIMAGACAALCCCASRNVSVANAASGKPIDQEPIENGCASKRRPICRLHSKENSATPQHIHASSGGPPSYAPPSQSPPAARC